jgi:hypothetical protein
MLSNCLSVFSYNEIEYFLYVNLLIVSLMLFYLCLFMVIYASSLILNSVYYNDVFIEVLMTLVSFVYILLIISPGLLLFLDYDFISALTNFNVYILGYQWAWNYNVMFNNLSYTFDQLVLPSSGFSTSSSMILSALSTYNHSEAFISNLVTIDRSHFTLSTYHTFVVGEGLNPRGQSFVCLCGLSSM